MKRFLILFYLVTACCITSCSKKDDTKPKESIELTGKWQGITDYVNADSDKATRYALNLFQTQSGAITGDGETSYSQKSSSQTNENEWRGPYHFTYKSIIYDHPVLRFTIKYDSGEEDEVFDGLVSGDKNKIEGNIKYVSVQGAGEKVIFKRK